MFSKKRSYFSTFEMLLKQPAVSHEKFFKISASIIIVLIVLAVFYISLAKPLPKGETHKAEVLTPNKYKKDQSKVWDATAVFSFYGKSPHYLWDKKQFSSSKMEIKK
jgi:hypothetical protein